MATMGRRDLTFLRGLAVDSDAIVINQADRVGYEEEVTAHGRVRMLSLRERGVGLSRNTGLHRSVGSICLLADDDIRLADGYARIVEDAFLANDKADVVIFNLDEMGPYRRRVELPMRVRWSNYMNFGAPRIAFRRESVLRERISFSLHFGGGSAYVAGEDTLFLRDCLRAGLRVVAVPEVVGTILPDSESSWFDGFDSKYFHDRGALYAASSGRVGYLLALQFAVRRRRLFQGAFSSVDAAREMVSGIRSYRQLGGG